MRLWTSGLMAGAAAAALALAATTLAGASGRERTISLHNIHTKETIAVVYKRDGRYVAEGLAQVNHVMRDWRRNESTKMDPELVDLLWEMHAELGSKEPIHIISGFRSRATNDMLRRTSGGQASESRHILGKAADVHFPDVPVKNLRYSALVREKGGVGYYPTSAIPFVHVDTDRVRAWPRLPRHELALLFPSGRTQHAAADGGAISKDDVRLAQVRHRDLAQEIARFHEARLEARTPTAVASAEGAGRARPPPATERPRQVAAAPAAVPPPRLVEPPRAVARPAARPEAVATARTEPEATRFTPPSTHDRARLTRLAALATEPVPELVSGPVPARRPAPALPSLSGTPGPAPEPPAAVAEPAAEPVAAAVDAKAGPPPTPAAEPPPAGGPREGWVPAPAWDDEHPEELSYRPFPIMPLLTATADEPLMAELVHHDVARTVDLIDQPGAMASLRFRPGEQMAQMLWSQQFTGAAVGLAKLQAAKAGTPAPAAGVESRSIRTSQR